MTDSVDISSLAEEIAKCERQTWEFEAPLFLDKSRARKVNGKFLMRVARVSELSLALDECDRHIKRRAKDSGLEADPDYRTNLRTAYVLHAVCRRTDKDAPVWPSPEWMCSNFSADELTVLLNLYQQCVRLSGPIDHNLDAEKAEAIAAILAVADPNSTLSDLVTLTPTQLGMLAVLLSVKVKALKDENARLIQQLRESTS